MANKDNTDNGHDGMAEGPEGDTPMGFFEHLAELRMRLPGARLLADPDYGVRAEALKALPVTAQSGALLRVAAAAGMAIVDGGCIGVFQGPRLESAAEIERARRDGCDMAGMTSLPEAGLARELGLDFAGIAVVSNWAAGVAGDHISEDDIAATLREPMGRVRRLVAALGTHLANGGTIA